MHIFIHPFICLFTCASNLQSFDLRHTITASAGGTSVPAIDVNVVSTMDKAHMNLQVTIV